MSKHKLSLGTAILVNVNIMMGAGLFLNTVVLSQRAGMLGCFSYILIGLLLLPLIASITTLISMHPDGGFYTFGAKEINPFAGFFSSWSYFVGKLASATLMIHTSVLLVQQILPVLQNISPFALDFLIIGAFVLLNMLNTQTGASIQRWFMGLKLIPIFFTIFAGLFLISGSNFTSINYIWEGIPSTIALVLFATTGFEATCSLSSQIKNAAKNGPRAIFISYGIVILTATLFQFMLYASVGSQLATQATYLGTFPTLLAKLFPTFPLLAKKIEILLYLAIASSALGGAYGIMYSNTWNLYTLAQNKHLIKSSYFEKLNKYFIPFACVIAEGFVCVLYLLIARADQLSLQQIGALGCVIAYTVSVLSLLTAKIKNKETPVRWWIPILGILNCALLIGFCIYNFTLSGITPLYSFFALLLFGVAIYFYSKLSNQNNQEKIHQ